MHRTNQNSQLLLEEIELIAGRAWAPCSGTWHIVGLRAGPAYWLGPTEQRALSEGELLVLAPGTAGSLLASQIGDVRLLGFAFDPSQFCGLLTFTEHQFFATVARTAQATPRICAANHPAARVFAELHGGENDQPGLVQRGQLLTIVGFLFREELARHNRIDTQATPARRRFEELMKRTPEGELLHHNPQELASLCGCTVRHFNRLFRQQFGTPPRARQTELRLRTASHLLLETESKIIDVAFESGYRNLSLFNSLFKRRYKMTPSAWRKKMGSVLQRRAGAAVAGLLLMLAGPLCAGAAEAVAPASAPASATNAPVSFEVKSYELTGNTLLPPTITIPLLSKHTGPTVTFETIRQALADLQMAYRDRGYISVAVALPPQQLTNGIVHVQVTEGRLAEIVVQGNRYFSSNNVMRALPSLRTNMILNSLVFQQELDRANGSRDRQIYPVINPGPEPGTSALELKIKDRLPLHGRFGLDNYSTPGTPELRASAAAQYNNLWQLEHQLGVQYSFSPEDYKRSSQPFYDQPLIANYSAFYRLPISPVNGTPRDRPYEMNEFGYDEVTRRFRPPPVSDNSELIFYASRSFSDTARRPQSETLTPPVIPPEGTLQVRDQIYTETLSVNENVGGRWSLPLPGLAAVRSSLSFGPDYKNYRVDSTQSRTFQATIFVPEVGQTGPPFSEFTSPPTESTRSLFNSLQYLPLTLLWEGGARDKWGSTSFSLNQSANYGDLLASADEFAATAGSSKANGNYYIVTAALTREQKLFADWGLRLHLDGQWANQPLISNEQMALGGQAGVRGYRDGEQYGDTGWRVQFEPHTPVLTVGVVNGVPVTAKLFTFVDYGERYLLDPVLRASSIQMLGLGAGMDSSIGSHVDFRIVMGIPALDVPGRPAGDARVNFSISAQF